MKHEDLERIVRSVGMDAGLMSMGAASCIYSEGCEGVTMADFQRLADAIEAHALAQRHELAGEGAERLRTLAHNVDEMCRDALRIPYTPWPDPHAHSADAYHRAVHRSFCDLRFKIMHIREEANKAQVPEAAGEGAEVDAASQAAQREEDRRDALEEAARLCESMIDHGEFARAHKAADEALKIGDEADTLHRLRHCSNVSLFNGALTRAASAIRALAVRAAGAEGGKHG